MVFLSKRSTDSVIATVVRYRVSMWPVIIRFYALCCPSEMMHAGAARIIDSFDLLVYSFFRFS